MNTREKRLPVGQLLGLPERGVDLGIGGAGLPL